MRLKLIWPLAVFIIAALAVCGWTGYAQKQTSQRTVWEYRIVNESEKVSLNDLGAQGWELVAVEMTGAQEVYFFKRAK